jgi:hypothetical protein
MVAWVGTVFAPFLIGQILVRPFKRKFFQEEDNELGTS